MAASIYATPPPDLSSEDTTTALSDVSNSSSSLNNNRNSSNNNNNTNSNSNTNNTNSISATTATISNNNAVNNNDTDSTNEAISVAPLATVPPTSLTTSITTLTVALKPNRSIADILTNNPRSPRYPPAISETQQNEHEEEQTTPLKPASSPSSSVARSSKSAVDTASNNETYVDDAAGNTIEMSVTPLSTEKITESAETSASAATIAAVAAAANAAMQLQLLEAINDAAKKRRKQHNPSRLGTTAFNVSGATGNDATTGADNGGSETEATAAAIAPALSIDYEEKLSKMLLPKSMEQLKETFELLQQQQQQQLQQQTGNISPNAQVMSEKKDVSPPHLVPKKEIKEDDEAEAVAETEAETETVEAPDQAPLPETDMNEAMENPYHTYCKKCGENFETEFRLGMHMLQEHRDDGTEQEEGNSDEDLRHKRELTPYDILASVNVKMERPDYDSSSPPQNSSAAGNNPHENITPLLANGKDPWMTPMPGMGFPFPPEAAAAAALSASGYLPLLGVPGFPPVDGLNRPPLRIFNPEAYCDLCNKEFCNKYFLKTHKANKHGIYDPAVPPTSDGANGGNPNTMSQMFQLQMQQQQLQQQQQQQQQQMQQQLQQKQQMALEDTQTKQAAAQSQSSATGTQPAPPAPPPVYCDICSKRFTNVFAMRRHRAKSHEQQPRKSPVEQPQPQTSQSKSDTSTPPAQNDAKSDSAVEAAAKHFQMPEGFRQDFTLEQEEVAFTPQPRKLSPQSQQQAREANFAHDKLKRLGVLNPEAFCELCCKEYCNKYFLRTHKWKRHGIFVPPDDLKDEQLQLAQKMPWPFFGMPGMPLNLMMANEKAMVAQRMFAVASANATSNATEEVPTHLAKRIKLELNDEEPTKGNDENQENKCITGRESEQSTQMQTTSVGSTPEPQKILAESFNSGANLPPSPETAVGLQNLQKLQSMIQQLNDLSGKRPVACSLCGRELENQYALHAHMMTEHATAMDSSSTFPLNFQQHLFQQQQHQQALKLSPTGSPGSVPSAGELRCNQCDRDFVNLQEFKQHIAEVHLLPGSPLREGFVTPERPINSSSTGSTRPPYTITPTSSYCEICNKELCNKYFMKTHMQRMHGIEIENGAQIGGVVCNICNKELCSKYFLRVHKHNTHGIIEEGAPLPQPRQNGLNFEPQSQQQQPQQPQITNSEAETGRGLNMSPFGGSGTSAESKTDQPDTRYYANYTEICPICTRRFRSPKWLRSHLLSDHGPAGMEKLREIEQQFGPLSKSTSPTLKIPNGAGSGGASGTAGVPSVVPTPTNLAQALQNLNAQHLLGNMPKNVLPGMFGAVAEQALQSPRLQEYQCSMCPFTTPYYAFLFIHERSHSILGGASEPAAATLEQLPQNSNIKDDKLKEEAKTKHEKEKDKTSLLPIVQNTTTTTDLTHIEPTNLSTRTPTPTPTPVTSSAGNKSKSSSQQKSITSEHKENHNSAVSKVGTTSSRTDKSRSIATSPIALPQEMLNEIANKMGKPASYALPQELLTGDASESQMQAFILEAQPMEVDGPEVMDTANGGESGEENCNNRFVPAIVYLPVRKRISGPITVSFNLTPA